MNEIPGVFLWVGPGAAVLTWIMVFMIIRLAPRVGLLDRPNERSLHSRVTPRGGGIGIVAAALGVALWWLWFEVAGSGLAGSLQAFLVAAGAVALVSLWDDFRSLGAGWRLLCHLAAAGVTVGFIGSIREVAIPLVGVIPLGNAGVALTVLWIVGLTNVYNFMDGIDGIAATQGVIAGLVWAAVGVAWSLPAVALLGLALAGACLGFLLHNWSPARIFMGDVGSAFLGFCFAVVPLLALVEMGDARAASIPGLAVLSVWPFVGDGFLTFYLRACRREPVWKAHRLHLYQKLVRSGLSHAHVSRLYACWSGACALTGLGWITGLPGFDLALVVVPAATLGGMYWYTRKREKAGGRHD